MYFRATDFGTTVLSYGYAELQYAYSQLFAITVEVVRGSKLMHLDLIHGLFIT